ncbi:hypothetical protein GBAR_LOCUS10872, partial [Geodia barretti]
GTVGVGVCHVQVDHTSPTSCTSTFICVCKFKYIVSSLLQFLCNIGQYISLQFRVCSRHCHTETILFGVQRV